MEDERENDASDEDEGLLDRLREMPVGTNDPNIIGDAGPTDVPPGSDPPQEGELEDDESGPRPS